MRIRKNPAELKQSQIIFRLDTITRNTLNKVARKRKRYLSEILRDAIQIYLGAMMPWPPTKNTKPKEEL